LVAKVNIDFVTEELGNRSQKEFFEDNILAEVFQKSSIPFFPVDIDSDAKTYLESAFDKKTALRDNILKNPENLNKQKSSVVPWGSFQRMEWIGVKSKFLNRTMGEPDLSIPINTRRPSSPVIKHN
jgi:hypothetical protein